MCCHRRSRQIEGFCDLLHGPTAPVDQDDGDALAFRESFERGNQTRLEAVFRR